MAVECGECGKASATLYYRRPAEAPRSLKWLKWGLYIAAFFAITSSISVIMQMMPLVDLADQLIAAVEGSTAADEAELRDIFRIFSNTIYMVFTIAFAGFIFLTVQYARLIRRGLKRADPHILSKIRRLGWTQLGFALGTFILLVSILDGLETLSGAPGLGPGVFVGPMLLILTRRRDLRAYFSEYKIEEAPSVTDARPSPSTIPGETWKAVPSDNPQGR